MNPESYPPLIGGPNDVEGDYSNEGNSDHKETQAGYQAKGDFSLKINPNLV